MVRHPYLDAATPLAFAHRGGSKERPENTLEAFQAAVDLGYGYLETDAQLTRDGVVIAFHDPVLDRVTDVSGRVDLLSLAEVKRADAGYRFSPDAGRSHPQRGRGVRVPTLEEVLTAFPGMRINIDAKTDLVAAPLVRVVERAAAWDRVCLAAFDDRRVARMRRLGGRRLCTSMGWGAVAAARVTSATGWIPPLGASCIQVPTERAGVRVVDATLIRAAHRVDLQVHVWTIDDRAMMGRLLDLGVDGIMTDRPTLLREVLRARNLWRPRA
jgi:glycerophosphoryl diester phosphodiesterase